MLLTMNLLNLVLTKECKNWKHIFKLPTIKRGHVAALGWDYVELVVISNCINQTKRWFVHLDLVLVHGLAMGSLKFIRFITTQTWEDTSSSSLLHTL